MYVLDLWVLKRLKHLSPTDVIRLLVCVYVSICTLYTVHAVGAQQQGWYQTRLPIANSS